METQGKTGALEEAEDISLRVLFDALLKQKWLILGCLFAGLTAGIVYLYFAPRIYAATALLEVPERRENAAGFESEDFRSDEVIKTIERNLQRISLMRRVAERPDIATNPAFLTSFEESGNSLRQAEELLDWTSVKLLRGTRLISVNVKHKNAALSAQLANTIVEEFIEERREKRLTNSTSAADSLVEEADKIGKRIRQSQAILQKLDSAIERKEEIDQKEDELAVLMQRYADAHPSVIQSKGLLEVKYATLATQLESIYPLLPDDQPESGGTDTVQPTPPFDPAAIDSVFERVGGYHESLAGEINTSQALFEAVLGRLKEADVNRGISTAQLEITEPAYESSDPVQPKPLPIMAASLALGGGLGLLLAWCLQTVNNSLVSVDKAERLTGLPVIAAIREQKRIASLSSLERHGNRIIHTLLEAGSGKSDGRRIPSGKKSRLEPLILLSDPGSPEAEAFRTLRASLELQGWQPEAAPGTSSASARTILVTSSVPGEGKSFVSSNLAVAFSKQENTKTLLIDADLRRPTVRRLFGVTDASTGIVGALSSRGPWQESIVHSGLPGLDLLVDGSVLTKRPAELLGSPRMKQLLREAAEEYDRIVIDCAPVHAVADALLFGSEADTSLLVAKAQGTPMAAVNRTRDHLREAVGDIAGLVLNRLPADTSMAGDSYHYYYKIDEGYGDNYS